MSAFNNNNISPPLNDNHTNSGDSSRARSSRSRQQPQGDSAASPMSSPSRRNHPYPHHHHPHPSAGQSALRQLASNRSAATAVSSSSNSNNSNSNASPLTAASFLGYSTQTHHQPPPLAAAVASNSLGGLVDRLESTSLLGSNNNNNNSNNQNNSNSLNFDLNRPPPRQQQQQQRGHSYSQSSNIHRDTTTNTTTANNATSQWANTNTSPAKTEGWTKVPLAPQTSPPPSQRSLHAAAVVHDSLYVFGGYDGQHRVNDFYQFDYTTRCWREIVTLNGHLVGGTVMNGVGGGGVVVGGNNGDHNHAHGGRQDPPGLQQHNRLHPHQPPQRHNNNNTPTITATGTVPTPRDRHAAVVHNSTFYIFGGFDGTSRVCDLYGFDVHRLVWRKILPRVNTTNGVGVGGNNGGNGVDELNNGGGGGLNMINVDAGGGGNIRNNNNNNNLDGDGPHPNQNNPQLQPQQQRAAAAGAVQPIHQYHDPPSPRHSHAAVVHSNSMYIFGGYDGSYRSDFHEFNFTSSTWRPVFGSGRSPRARYRSTACVHEHTMILFGGHDGTRHLADVHTFDFESCVWGVLVIDGVPPLPRDSHVSVVYKDSVFVFGGSTGSAMNDLHELMLPSKEKDLALLVDDDAVDNGVVEASDLSSVVVGGGGDGPEDGGGPSSSPVKPRTAKWRQIPQMNGEGTAVHRFCHVGAVHNGSFYVFGGYDGSHRLKDFVKYDLAADDLLETDIPPPSILADLRSFLDDEDAMSLSDITLMVEGIPVRAHKLMLMRCPYFKAMLLGSMSESTQAVVHIEIVRHCIFTVVLEYLYTDDVDISLDIAMELFVAADLFAIPRLQSMCERRLLESMTVENAATIFHTADVHSAVSLRSKALGYVLSHFEAVSKTDAFEDMARSNVELVFEILRSR